MSRFFDSKLIKLEPYTPGEQPKGLKKLIKLNTNESPFAPSIAVKKAIQTYTTDDLRLYPDPECTDFLAKLASTYNVKTNCVICGNGSDELLAFAFACLCESGAVFADITYGFYKVFAQLYSVNYKTIPLKQNFSIDINDYKHEKGTVFLANPNAPTGLALPIEKIEELLKQNKNRLIVVDEAYVDFGAESAVCLLQKYDNLMVIGTFSKSRNLAGMRIGYAVSSKDLIADLNTVKFSFNPYNVNRLSLAAGYAALEDELYFKMCCKEIMLTRQIVTDELVKMGFETTNSVTNFIFAKPPNGISAQQFYTKLKQKNVLVRHFNLPRIENYVRITIGTKEQMESFLNISKEIISAIN